MKKLMTMLAAVATAFGLYAADSGFLSGAGFDTSDTAQPDNGVYTWLMGDPTGDFVAGYWTGTEKAAIVDETYTYTGTHPAQFDDDPDRERDQYLKIDSGTDLVSQRVLPGSTKQTIDADKGLYFDGLVQFTSFEEAPTIDSNAKIAVFPMVDDPEAAEPVSHLIVAAQGTTVTNLWTTDAEIDDGWHRVTIKMINNIKKTGETAQAGFVVYVDGTAVTSTDAKDALDPDKLTSEAKYFYNDGKLFGSLVANTAEITDVAFGGKGAIDEIAFTETAPSFAGSPKFAYLTGANNIASFDFDGKTWTPAGADLEVMLVGTDSDTVLAENITAVPGYFPTNTAEIVAVTAGQTSTVGGAKALGATVVIGTETKYFESAAAALNDLLNNVTEATTATLTLNADSGALSIDNAFLTLTIDLAGQKIEQGENDAAAITLSNGSLKIIDTDGDGEVNGNAVALSGSVAISAWSGLLEITGGTFNGYVGVLENLTISSCDPAISVADNTDAPAATFTGAADGKTFVKDGTATYWIVDDPPVNYFTVTVPAADGEKVASVSVKTNDQDAAWAESYTLVEGTKVDVLYTAGTGYKITANASTNIAELAEDVAVIAPTFEAIQYAINIAAGDGEGGSANPAFVTIEDTYPKAIALTRPTPPESKEFDKWVCEDGTIDGDTLTLDACPSAAVTVTATYKDAGGWHPDPTKDAGKTAEEAYGIPSTSKLAGADAVALGNWATNNKIDFAEFQADPDSFYDAFLLDTTKAGVDEARKAFKITSITQDSEGDWIVKVTGEKGDEQPYNANALVDIVPYTGIEAGDDAGFFQATLKPIPPTLPKE